MMKKILILAVLISGILLMVDTTSALKIKTGDVSVECSDNDYSYSYFRSPGKSYLYNLFFPEWPDFYGWASFLEVKVNDGTVKIDKETIDTPCTLRINIFKGMVEEELEEKTLEIDGRGWLIFILPYAFI
jgi:hypothetical protein